METQTDIETGFGIQSAKAPSIVRRHTPTGRQAPDAIYGDFKSNSQFRWVPTDSIYVDSRYQRTLDKGRTSIMAHNWNQNIAGAMVVSLRPNGRFYVVDGQHRHAAIQMMQNPPDVVWCEVFENLTIEDEARLFYELDTKRHSLTSGQGFTALLAAQDPEAISVQQAAANAGMTVDYAKGAVAGNIRAFKTLQNIHRRVGQEKLTRILRTVHLAWPEDPHASAGSVLNGLEIFYNRFPTIETKKVVEALSRTTPGRIEAVARAINSNLSSAVSKSVAEVIQQQYNKGKRTGRI